MKAVLTAVGINKPGILAAITSKLAQKSINILDISQKILTDVFSLFMILEFDEEKVKFDDLKKELDEVANVVGIKIVVYEEALLRYMYRI